MRPIVSSNTIVAELRHTAKDWQDTPTEQLRFEHTNDSAFTKSGQPTYHNVNAFITNPATGEQRKAGSMLFDGYNQPHPPGHIRRADVTVFSQRRGIATAMGEAFKTQTGIQPIHSDELTYDGRQFSQGNDWPHYKQDKPAEPQRPGRDHDWGPLSPYQQAQYQALMDGTLLPDGSLPHTSSTHIAKQWVNTPEETLRFEHTNDAWPSYNNGQPRTYNVDAYIGDLNVGNMEVHGHNQDHPAGHVKWIHTRGSGDFMDDGSTSTQDYRRRGIATAMGNALLEHTGIQPMHSDNLTAYGRPFSKAVNWPHFNPNDHEDRDYNGDGDIDDDWENYGRDDEDEQHSDDEESEKYPPDERGMYDNHFKVTDQAGNEVKPGDQVTRNDDSSTATYHGLSSPPGPTDYLGQGGHPGYVTTKDNLPRSWWPTPTWGTDIPQSAYPSLYNLTVTPRPPAPDTSVKAPEAAADASDGPRYAPDTLSGSPGRILLPHEAFFVRQATDPDEGAIEPITDNEFETHVQPTAHENWATAHGNRWPETDDEYNEADEWAEYARNGYNTGEEEASFRDDPKISDATGIRLWHEQNSARQSSFVRRAKTWQDTPTEQLRFEHVPAEPNSYAGHYQVHAYIGDQHVGELQLSGHSDDHPAGHINWIKVNGGDEYDDRGPDYRRRGIATAMGEAFRAHTGISPMHSDQLTSFGRPFSQAVGWPHYDPEKDDNYYDDDDYYDDEDEEDDYTEKPRKANDWSTPNSDYDHQHPVYKPTGPDVLKSPQEPPAASDPTQMPLWPQKTKTKTMASFVRRT